MRVLNKAIKCTQYVHIIEWSLTPVAFLGWKLQCSVFFVFGEGFELLFFFFRSTYGL